MRFTASGPSIPHQLLLARDEGRVVFFCGAGVSIAEAGLPSFPELAEQVINALGVETNSPARKVLETLNSHSEDMVLSGLISADRIFSILEDEFEKRDIEQAIAEALRQEGDIKLSAHQTILDLARSQEGHVKLVTTNFDLLFEACETELPVLNPSDLSDNDIFHGIVHLHGKVTKDYSGADANGFVLSSSSFGHAYLADGWATQFIKSILNKYYVVFIGYSADDPPVRYLLEALNRHSNSLEGVYAFDIPDNDAFNKWKQKGAHPIICNNYKTLWDTLTSWAERARNPKQWCQDIIEKAQLGPKKLEPFERSQIAHIASTADGVAYFTGSTETLPAEWLHVFDPELRYADPEDIRGYHDIDKGNDPFTLYGLDSDPIPDRKDTDLYEESKAPDNVWNCFGLLPYDLNDITEEHIFLLNRYATQLPRRLQLLSHWITNILDQPATVHWALRQSSLHSTLLWEIEHTIQRSQSLTPVFRSAWRYILESYAKKKISRGEEWYQLKDIIAEEGWTERNIKDFFQIHSPFMTVSLPYHFSSELSGDQYEMTLSKLIRLEVNYPNLESDIQYPEDKLQTILTNYRVLLETALSLEYEISEMYPYLNIPPINPPDQNAAGFERGYGINAYFFEYISCLRQFISMEPSIAKAEALHWRTNDTSMAAHILIWAAGEQSVFSSKEACDLLCELENDDFWEYAHQRDLLLTFNKRWNKFTTHQKQRLEGILLSGDKEKFNDEDDKEHNRRKAHNILSRIHWMMLHGCRFTFDFEEQSDLLKKLAPDWEDTEALRADKSIESRSGWIKTNSDPTPLINEPITSLLEKAAQLEGRSHNDPLTEDSPISGFVEKYPTKILTALQRASGKEKNLHWAWQKLLNAQNERTSRSRFIMLIAARISSLPHGLISAMIHPITYWLKRSAKTLSAYPTQFDQLWNCLITILTQQPQQSKSAIVSSNRDIDILEFAINAPAGQMAEALMENLTLNKPYLDSIPNQWLQKAESLLALQSPAREHALVMFAHDIARLFDIGPEWAQKQLIAVLQSNDEKDIWAFWYGYLWNTNQPNEDLFIALKPHLLHLAKRTLPNKRGFANNLSALILTGWREQLIDTSAYVQYVTDEELRSVILHSTDAFKQELFWNLRRWLNDTDNENPYEELVVRLLRDVWPRQKIARSSEVSKYLINLAFSDIDFFPKIIDSVMPLIRKIETKFTSSPFRKLDQKIASTYPEQVLELLYRSLPDQATLWPYSTREILSQIIEGNSSLLHDSRYIELKRRWDSR